MRGCSFSSSDDSILTTNYFHSAFKTREVSDLSLQSPKWYLSFLCVLTHEVNKRCLRKLFQQVF